jgi:hypothetical protein
VTDGPIRVFLETAPKKTFAAALDWPGWVRAGKTETAAIESLRAYAPRYRSATRGSPLVLPSDAADRLEVVERASGDASTEFGVPGAIAKADRRPVDGPEAEQLAAIVSAAWATFDRIAAAAPAELRKGPRGGGRDTAKVIDHVVAADHGYTHQLGIKVPAPGPNDRTAVARMREAVLDVLRRPSDGTPLGKRWTQRYAARRIAWHALDHAWEIEDRTDR